LRSAIRLVERYADIGRCDSAAWLVVIIDPALHAGSICLCTAGS